MTAFARKGCNVLNSWVQLFRTYDLFYVQFMGKMMLNRIRYFGERPILTCMKSQTCNAYIKRNRLRGEQVRPCVIFSSIISGSWSILEPRVRRNSPFSRAIVSVCSNYIIRQENSLLLLLLLLVQVQRTTLTLTSYS